MLGAIGLDEAQEAAYRALVALGAAEAGELADRLALSEDEAVRTLRDLERQGLAARSSARATRWVAAPPAVALGALLTHRRRELEQAELSAALLAEEHRIEAAEAAVHDLVEVVTGADAIAHRRAQLELGAADEVCALVTGAPAALTGAAGAGRRRAPAGRVRHRVVCERPVLSDPSGLAGLTAALGRDEQVRARVVERVPTRLVVADRTLAMVPLTRRAARPTALVVHAGDLVEALLGLFEAVWREGLPLRLGAHGAPGEERPDEPDATDLEVLSLLLAGLTDASVAKQLDLGLRTVQRRVKRLMELTGVTTRLQLGWHAYERGWVARDGGR